ncbi:hypothetical protein GGR57DRAFT_491348 [Xylariaceae sp. FL1272]|nr:hypothetical protein GGR57DRAFT_491348 [Xylariaceae sp. FL1272]
MDCHRSLTVEWIASQFANLHEDDPATGASDSRVASQHELVTTFKLWSGNIGAHRKGRSSLDWRLRDASNLKDLVTNLLVDLNKTLHDDEVGFGEIQIGDEDKDTETLEIAADVGDISIDTSYFEDYDIEHVKSKLSNVDNTLASRLGKAISQRRQYFKYRESHRQKLSQGLMDEDFAKPEAGALSTVASSIPLALKNLDTMSNSGASQTSYATSGPASGRLKMPPLPDQASQGPFEYYRRHVSADLRPYICLLPDCLTSEQQFLPVVDLERHIHQTHPQVSSRRDIGLVLDFCKHTRPWPDQVKCPLCEQLLHSKHEYGRHVGRHQTELALFSLPNTSGDSDEGDLSENEGSDEHNSVYPEDEQGNSGDGRNFSLNLRC